VGAIALPHPLTVIRWRGGLGLVGMGGRKQRDRRMLRSREEEGSDRKGRG